MDTITSTKNPIVKRLKELSNKQAREESGLMLIEGEVMIGEALKCGLTPKEALYTEEKSEFAASLNCAKYMASVSVINAACDTKSPQGICAAFEMPLKIELTDMPERIVALDGVQDPGNVGTIWRTADAAGFGALLLGAGCADAMSPKVVRSAMGSSFRLPACDTDDLAGALNALRARGYEIICSDLNGEDFYKCAPGARYALVIGSEAHGISKAVKDEATCLVKLPMRGGAESLNAAVAAGIMMYELSRRMPDTKK